ncbi:Hypothetical predicted protein, partial [Podarcis lilfordi]
AMPQKKKMEKATPPQNEARNTNNFKAIIKKTLQQLMDFRENIVKPVGTSADPNQNLTSASPHS